MARASAATSSALKTATSSGAPPCSARTLKSASMSSGASTASILTPKLTSPSASASSMAAASMAPSPASMPEPSASNLRVLAASGSCGTPSSASITSRCPALLSPPSPAPAAGRSRPPQTAPAARSSGAWRPAPPFSRQAGIAPPPSLFSSLNKWRCWSACAPLRARNSKSSSMHPAASA